VKPLEAAQNLTIARSLIMRGEPLQPSLRAWLCGAIDQRLADPSLSIDQRLGLSSRSGGRLHAASKLPQRDKAIADLSGGADLPTHRAAALALRVKAHRLMPDPALTAIERQLGRIPSTPRQLLRILLGQTEASKHRPNKNLKAVDVSLVAAPAPLGHDTQFLSTAQHRIDN